MWQDSHGGERMDGLSQRPCTWTSEARSSQSDWTTPMSSQDTGMADSQDTRTTGLTQGMAHCAMHEGPPGLEAAEAQCASTRGWQGWTEDAIDANFEFI